MALNRSVKLASGALMPTIGLGTWKSQPDEVGRAIQVALETGYKHFDFAAVYGNEEEIGMVLEEWFEDPKHKREDYFFTSKLWNDSHLPSAVPKALDRTLSDLRLEYLDLYLMHWPFSIAMDGKTVLDPYLRYTWVSMEKLIDTGKVKHIGLSNWTIPILTGLLTTCKIKPAVNQCELHPYLPQKKLVDFCHKNDIVFTAYAPLGANGTPLVREDPVVLDMAKRLNKTPAQVLISYHASRGITVIPKSVNPDRIKSNFDDFVMSEEDITILDQIHLTTTKRYYDPNVVFGVHLFLD